MTFEEFFTKKKIDLKALKAADEPLFEEFKAHYSAMGEKSFDHSKKFWFNKLRKSFHLTEEEVVVVKKTIQEDKIETTSPTTDANASKPAGFKPRFKAPVPSEPANQKEEHKTQPSTTRSEAADSTVTETPKAAGFKPRFKSGVTKSTEQTEETSTPKDSSEASVPETPKPTGFKPRFKPGVTKVAAPEQSATLEENPVTPSETTAPAPAETAKPTGFKPRFKAGVTKTESADSSQKKTMPVEDTKTTPVSANSAATADTSSPAEAPNSSASEISKPAGFKPRFKAGITKTANTDSTQEVVPPTEDLNIQQTAAPTPQATPTLPESNRDKPADELQQNNEIAQEQAAANKPTGFKPRFKAGLTKIDKKEE